MMDNMHKLLKICAILEQEFDKFWQLMYWMAIIYANFLLVV